MWLRSVLAQCCHSTQLLVLYMSGCTLRSWLHYVDLRGDNGTQKEHMQIARSVGGS